MRRVWLVSGSLVGIFHTFTQQRFSFHPVIVRPWFTLMFVVFHSHAEAIRTGFQIHDSTKTGYLVRTKRGHGRALARTTTTFLSHVNRLGVQPHVSGYTIPDGRDASS
jgi:hypothetical protein